MSKITKAAGAILLVTLLLTACYRDPPSIPAAQDLEYYRIPWANAFPSDVAVDEAGRLWFTDRLTHALGVFDLNTKEFRRIELPTAKAAPYGLVRGAGGFLWFGESNGGRLGRIDPATGEIEEIEIPALEAGPTLLARAGQVIWFTSKRDSAFGYYDSRTAELRMWKGLIPEAYGIAAVGKTVFVSSHGGHQLHAISCPCSPQPVHQAIDLAEEPEDGTAPLPRLGIRRITSGPEGRVWVSEYTRGRITAVDPRTNERIHVETLDQPARPYGIAVGSSGRVWYSEQGNDRVVVYDPRTGSRHALDLPLPGGTVRDLAIDDQRDRVWLPLSDIGVIAVVQF